MSADLVAEAGLIRECWRWNAVDTTSTNPRAAAALHDAPVILGESVERAEAIVDRDLQLGRSTEASPSHRLDGPCRVRMPDPLHSRQSLSKSRDM